MIVNCVQGLRRARRRLGEKENGALELGSVSAGPATIRGRVGGRCLRLGLGIGNDSFEQVEAARSVREGVRLEFGLTSIGTTLEAPAAMAPRADAGQSTMMRPGVGRWGMGVGLKFRVHITI